MTPHGHFGPESAQNQPSTACCVCCYDSPCYAATATSRELDSYFSQIRSWILDLDYFFNPCLRSSLSVHQLDILQGAAAAGSLARRRRAAATAAAAVGRGSGRPAGGRKPQACAAEGRRSAAEGRAKKTCFPGRRPAAEGHRPQAEGCPQ